MDKISIEQALESFAKVLIERPEWMIIIDRNGKLIARTGHYPLKYATQITDEIAATQADFLSKATLESLDKLNHGNLLYSISFGGDFTLFLFNLNDSYFIAMSYDGIKSFDAIIEGFHRSYGLVMEALYPL